MNLRDLKYLIAVAKYRHFGNAAKACFVSQPTLSYQLKKLEDFLEVKLFDRDNQSVIITPIGKKILEKAENAVFEAEKIVEIAKLSKDPFYSELVVGIIPTIAPYLLPRIINELKLKYPNLKLLIREDTTENLLKLIEANEVDVMVQALPMDLGDYKVDVFYRDEFFVAVPAGHEWESRDCIKREELDDKSILLLEKEHCLSGHIMQQLCKLKNSDNEYDFRATSLETLRHMVIGGIAITIIPELAVNKNQIGISYIPFCDPKPYRDIAMVWKKSSSRDELLTEISSELRRFLSQ